MKFGWIQEKQRRTIPGTEENLPPRYGSDAKGAKVRVRRDKTRKEDRKDHEKVIVRVGGSAASVLWVRHYGKAFRIYRPPWTLCQPRRLDLSIWKHNLWSIRKPKRMDEPDWEYNPWSCWKPKRMDEPDWEYNSWSCWKPKRMDEQHW